MRSAKKQRLQMSTASQISIHVSGEITGSTQSFHLQTLRKAQNSILEPGISRFDYLKRIETDKDEFLLVEVYRDDAAAAAHQKTPPFRNWEEAVADNMAVPRRTTKYKTLFPPSEHWLTSPTASKCSAEEMSKSLPWGISAPHVRSGIPNNNIAASNSGMLAVVVDIQVTPADISQFIEATLENCRNSVREGGVSRFDFLQDEADEGHFQLVEVYNSPDAPAAHKASAHYAAWAAVANPVMARPREARKYITMFPAPLFWHESSGLTHSSNEGKGLSGVSGNTFAFLAPKLVFGRGIAAKAISEALKEFSISKPFIITGASGLQRLGDSLLHPVFKDLGGVHTSKNHYGVGGEPTVEDAREVTATAKKAGCDGVVAIGGGSSLDLAKAVAALITNEGDVLDYIEVFGKGQAISRAPVPLIAVPTTAGTGSEATKNAVLKSNAHGLKASMRHNSMLPDQAIIDPTLMTSCPPDVTAHVGLDTLCQNIEPYISNSANPITDALARDGILRAARSLRRAVSNGADIDAREDLAIASTLGGIALANAKLGVVHGFAGVLGGMFEYAPHGALCATLLPSCMAKNSLRLSELVEKGGKGGGIDADTASIRLGRIIEVAQLVTGNPDATWQDGVAWLASIVKDLQVPGLNALCKLDEVGGITPQQVEDCLKATAGSSSIKGNPIILSEADLRDILESSL